MSTLDLNKVSLVQCAMFSKQCSLFSEDCNICINTGPHPLCLQQWVIYSEFSEIWTRIASHLHQLFHVNIEVPGCQYSLIICFVTHKLALSHHPYHYHNLVDQHLHHPHPHHRHYPDQALKSGPGVREGLVVGISWPRHRHQNMQHICFIRICKFKYKYTDK